MNEITRRRTRRPKGAILLFFLLFALPLLWLCGAIAVDYTRVVLGQRQAGQIADSASLAGALQTLKNDPNDPLRVSSNLDYTRALDATFETITRSVQADVGRQITIVRVEPRITAVGTGTTPAQVEVILDYRIDGLLFLGILGDYGQAQGQVSRTAFVCSPGTNLTYGGSCARPTG